jgi:hypothetical protein
VNNIRAIPLNRNITSKPGWRSGAFGLANGRETGLVASSGACCTDRVKALYNSNATCVPFAESSIHDVLRAYKYNYQWYRRI